jgi:hypothetical protein
MNRIAKLLMMLAVVAVLCGLGSRARTASAEANGAMANVDARLAAVYQPLNEQLEVFTVGDDGALRGVWKEHNSIWRPPFALTAPGFAPPGAPVAAVFQPRNNQVEVFLVSNDGTVWDIWKMQNGPWQPAIALTEPNFAPAGAAISAVVQPRNDQIEVFVIDRNGALRDMWKEHNGPWQPAITLSRDGFAREGQALSAVYYPNDEHIEVFTVTRDGTVQVVWKAQNGRWQPPGALTDPNFAPTGAPLSAVYYPNGEALEVFVVGNDGILRGLWKTKGTDWRHDVTLTAPGFFSPRAPVAAVYQPRNDQLEVFAVAKDGAIWDHWKAKGINWQPGFKVTDANVYREFTPLAAVSQPLNDQLEVFAVGGDGAVRDSYKARNGPWQAPYSTTGVYLTPVVRPGDCTRFFQKWRGGYENGFLMENCIWIMGIEPYCRAHDAFTAVEYGGGDGNSKYLKCAPYSHPDDALDQIEHIGRGVYEGLVTAYVAAAPYLGPLVSGAACANGVIYACAALALDIANLAGASPPGIAADAVDLASDASKCIGGDIATCAALGIRGAKAAGVTIPGVDVGKIAEDARQCAGGDFAACVRLGVTAADAGGVPIPAGLGNSDIIRVQDCLNAKSDACLALGKEAAQAAARATGFPLNGVLNGIDNAKKCSAGDVTACTTLGKALVGSAVAQGVENANKCRTGDTDACFALGQALAGNELAQDVQKGLDCVHGDRGSCIAIGKAVVGLLN